MTKRYKYGLIIFLAALSLRLLLAAGLYTHNGGDYGRFVSSIKNDGYYEIAVNLVDSHVFQVTADLGPTALRTLGYPVMMASFLFIFGNIWFFLLLQIIVASLIPLLGAKVSLEITGHSRVAKIVALFLVIEPVGVFLSVRLLSETFFTFFFLLATLCLIRLIKYDQRSVRLAALGGLWLGLATLIRPTTLYLPFILALLWGGYLWLYHRRGAMKPILAFLFIFIILLAPWFYRNYRVFGEISYTSIQQQGLYTMLVPSILAVKNHEDFSQAGQNFFVSEGFSDFPTINSDRDGWFQRRALAVIWQHPRELITVSGITLFTFFTHDGTLDLLRGLGLVPTNGNQMTVMALLKQPFTQMVTTVSALLASPYVLILIMRVIWFFISLLLAGSILYSAVKKNFNALTVLAFVCIAYFALTSITIGFAINARFRFPVNTFILIGAISFLFTRFKKQPA